ncbi:DsrE family protein [Arcobacter roscoffensis]|uniref:DsrE family protein n=1 Tax=Arcobacter roscoffensis TaxID=2961520 RepID=A0ABY5E352_9BACT|nr:DsrE family protein [Arcobacter roscoffensis]UTJ06009.1 DsrE family protein [Arcobacter roscoffensis]
MKKVLLVIFLSIFAYAQSTFSEPKPSFDNPRKVAIQLYDSELKKVNHNLSTIYNILKEYPSESLKVVVIAYGNGVRALKKDYDKKTLSRINSLMEYDVEFIVCKNTMETMKWTQDDFIEDLEYVQAGIVELIERQVDGYVGIIAY